MQLVTEVACGRFHIPAIAHRPGLPRSAACQTLVIQIQGVAASMIIIDGASCIVLQLQFYSFFLPCESG